MVRSVFMLHGLIQRTLLYFQVL
uniref:Uncharacterized protein n=1 Tax=Tetranychus urticae TaxID=32264 RepID=T1K1U8_TETUR